MRKLYKLTNKSFAELKVKNYGELWEKLKDDYDGLEADCFTSFKRKSDENLYRAVLSSPIEDRHGEVVQQKFRLANYKENPVVLDSHKHEGIENIIGRMPKIGKKDGMLQGDIEFALMNPKGALAKEMVEGGFINAISIGFIPLKFGKDYTIIEESELLEVSLVSVPANPRALFDRIKAVCSEEEEEAVEEVQEETVEEKAEENIEEVEEDPTEKLVFKIAKELQKMTPQNQKERKRKIYKHLREVIRQDMAIR